MVEQGSDVWLVVVIGVMTMISVAATVCAVRQKKQRLAYSLLASHALFVAIALSLFMTNGAMAVAASCWGAAILSFVAAIWQFSKEAPTHEQATTYANELMK